MKKTMAIIFILVAALCCNSCNNNKCINADPCPSIEVPALYISIVDSEGNDLFFGENSVYDPRDVVFIPAGGYGYPKYWNPEVSDICFALDFSEEKTSVFYVEFIPNRIDTIKIESSFEKWIEWSPCCGRYGIYKNDLFFNDIPVLLIDYGYKIEIK